MVEKTPYFVEVTKDIPLHRFLGVELSGYGNGQGEVRIPVNENIVNSSGAVHGGIYYVLCDIACTLAFSTALDDKSFYVTHDINVSVLQAAFAGELIARAKCIKVGKRLGFVECRIWSSNDELLAVGRVTKTILPKPQTL